MKHRHMQWHAWLLFYEKYAENMSDDKKFFTFLLFLSMQINILLFYVFLYFIFKE